MSNKFSNIKERVLYLAEIQEGNKQTFFKNIGMSYGNFTGEAKKTPLNSSAIENILLKYPNTNVEWLITGTGNILKVGNEMATNHLESSIPFYSDVTSIGGTNLASNNKAEGVEYINPGDWFPGATAAIRHYGESMQEYPSGCILVLKELKDLIHGFIFGQNYVLEYGDDWNRVTKRVQKNGKLLMAYSTNLDTYPDGTLIHQPFEILKIHRAWRIVGCIIKMESSNGIISVHK